jgi:hypothetical protein
MVLKKVTKKIYGDKFSFTAQKTLSLILNRGGLKNIFFLPEAVHIQV